MRSTAFIAALATAVALSLSAAGAGAATLATTPTSVMFKSGYNKCKLTTLAALNRATARKFASARFDGKTCTWSSSDGNYTVLVDTHPAGYVELLGPKIGRHTNGDVAKLIGVPGASRAVLETFSHANTGRYAKDLLAVYPQGVVQVSVNYSTLLSDKTMVAVVRLLTHT